MGVLVLLWLLAGWTTTPAGRARPIWVMVGTLALLARFATTWFILGNNGDSAGTDGLLYHKVAIEVMSQLQAGIPLWRVEYAYTWYTLVLGIQYTLFGPSRFLGCFMNAAYAMAGAQVLLHLGLRLGATEENKAVSLRKAMLVAGGWLFMPSLVVWTADTRKEALSLLLAMLLWYLSLLLFQRRGRIRPHAIALMGCVCLLLWLSTLLRLYMLIPLGGGLLAGLALQWRQTRRRETALFLALVMATLLVFGIQTVLPRVEGNHALNMERTEGGDEDLSAEYQSVLAMLLERDLPQAVNGFLTEPHPRHIKDISDLQGQSPAMSAVLAEMLLWYLLMFLSLFGMMEATLRGRTFLMGMIVFILLYSGVNILVAENISDTYYRYRAFIIAPVMLFSDPFPALRLMRHGLRSPLPDKANHKPE